MADPLRNARRTLVAAGTLGLFGGIEAMALRVQLLEPRGTLATGGAFFGLLSLHASTMVFLALLPAGLALASVRPAPGAEPVRVPGGAVAALVVGGLLVHTGLVVGLADGGLLDALPRGGWAGAAWLASPQQAPGAGVDAWAAGLLAALGASCAIAWRLLSTGARARPLSPAAAGTVAGAGLALLSLPVLALGLVAVLADRHLGTGLLDPSAGGRPELWSRVVWPAGLPAPLAAVLPPLGFALEALVPEGEGAAAQAASAGLLATAALAASLWLLHAVLGAAGDATALRLAEGAALGACVVAGALGGRRPAPPAAARSFAWGALLFAALGAASGAAELFSPARGTGQTTVAHLHLALAGAGACGLFAGLYARWRLLTGHALDDDWGRAHAAVLVPCALLTFGALYVLGREGMPRRVSGWHAGPGAEVWSAVASLAAFALGGAFVLFVLVAWLGRRLGD